MDYVARYSVLINGGLFGVENINFEAEDDKEAVSIALQNEEDYSSKKKQLMLDYLIDENGNEIEINE